MMTSQNWLFVMCSTNPKNGEFESLNKVETYAPINVNPVGGGGGGSGSAGKGWEFDKF